METVKSLKWHNEKKIHGSNGIALETDVFRKYKIRYNTNQ
jgi:hypothetical protein